MNMIRRHPRATTQTGTFLFHGESDSPRGWSCSSRGAEAPPDERMLTSGTGPFPRAAGWLTSSIGLILDPLPFSWSVIPFNAWSNSLIEPNRSSTSRAIAFWQIQSSAVSSPRRIDDGAGGLVVSSFT